MRSPLNRRPDRLAPAVLLALAALAPIACRLNTAESEAYFEVEADSSLLDCSRLVVVLADGEGNVLDTLFDDSLASLHQLRRLPAGSYRGGPARITLLAYRGGTLVHGETRIYDGRTQRTLALENPAEPPENGPSANVAAGHVPEVDSVSPDTVVSIRDSVELAAWFKDADGDLAGYAWACGAGDGARPDTVLLSGHHAKTLAKRGFADSGSRICDLRVWDRAGHAAGARIKVRVEWDPPTADAGDDTTVAAGSIIRLHARGDDRFGPIVSREWKIGTGPFKPVPQQETVHTAPQEPGLLLCILKVTDSDGLSAQDTLLVTVLTSP